MSEPCEVCGEHPANCRCGHPVFAREQKDLIDRLKAELALSKEMYANAIDIGARALIELAEAREAIGLGATAKPSMEMRPDDPVGMAQEAVAENAKLRALCAEWMKFSDDIVPSCAAGSDQLFWLRDRTEKAAGRGEGEE